MDLDADRLLDVAGVVLVLVVLGSIPLLAYGATQATSGDGEAAPDVEWSVERVDDSDHVRIEHASGDTLYADEIALTVDGHEQPTPFSGAVRPGDEATITTAHGSKIVIHWIGGNGERDPLHAERV